MKTHLTVNTRSLLARFVAILLCVASNYTIAQTTNTVRRQTAFTPAFPGNQKPLIRGSFMPYVTATVGGAEGLLQLDFGSTFSTIDAKKFKSGIVPKPISGSTDRFSFDDFFGSENKEVTLSSQSYSIQLPTPFVQAGIIGTDILCERIIVIDYINNVVYSSSPVDFYAEKSLREKGFKPVSTVGYYAKESIKLNNNCTSNVPTVPIRIGAAVAVAQIDPGYDDKIYPHAVNINRAFFNSLTAAGISLIRVSERDIQLTTCATKDGRPVSENILGYKLGVGQSFEIMGSDGKPVFVTSEASLFLKDTPLEAKKCGGIGSWQIPAAQLGASFLIDAQQVIFDPFASLVWFKGK